MALITSVSNLLSNLRTYTLTQITNITNARFRGDTEGTKANQEYHYNNIAGYLKALGWGAYWKNTLYVKLDAPVDFDGSDGMIYQTAQEAVDSIATTGASKPTAINPYVIIGDPLVDFSAVDWSAHITAGTYPFITTQNIQGSGSSANNTVKSPVRVATTAVLPACTYNNTAGTLTGDANGALSAQDGVTLVAGEALLVKDQVAGLQNGIYTVTQIGTAGTPFILTRRSDANSSAKMVSGISVLVSEGTIIKGHTFYLSNANPIILGTDALVFKSINPIKYSYIAQLSQVGTGDITELLGYSSLPTPISYVGSYAGVGSYEIAVSMTLDEKTEITLLENFLLSGTAKARARAIDDLTLGIGTVNGGVPANDVLLNTTLIIRQYF